MKYDFRELNEISLAYAITIHKSQGKRRRLASLSAMH
jgi:ATP-dependent exoDNAse (exonuclease V) alpha subunit